MDVNYNTRCYKLQKYIYDTGILDDSVDATYIIHLKDNGRYEHIQEQLKEYHPTKIVYIAFNKGFKKCEKKLIEQVSYQDLSDAFLQCFKHANNNNYNNVLILEDDFIFSPNIKKRENIKSINDFLNKKKNEEFIYYLGCNPILVVPCTIDLKHYKSYKSLSSHAVIYSKKTITKTLNVNLKHWDVIIENGVQNKYLYHIPLCYQTYPETENKQTWFEKDNIAIGYAKNKIIELLNLDKTPEPGFSILYFFAKVIIPFVFLLSTGIFIFLIYYIFITITYDGKYIKNNKNTKFKKFHKK
jgi:hypothetical protein